ncbi:MAG TPA: hypothetical protein VF669_14860 [Tepidisphaeraceae bacterium]|jgi:hypothetical protein
MGPDYDQRQTTLLISRAAGNFGNQLLVFGHLIALAEEHTEFRLLNYSFWRYADHCRGTEHNPLCRYPFREGDPHSKLEVAPRMLARIKKVSPNLVVRGTRQYAPRALQAVWPGRKVQWYRDEPLAIGDEAFLSTVRGRRMVLMSGWMLRDWALFEKHEEAMRSFFAPPEKHQRVADEYMKDLRQRYDPLIGLVMRQGDYRVWREGEFYIESARYRTFAEQLRERFGPKTGFVVACDEKQDQNLYAGLNAHWCTGVKAGSGHYLETFAELAKCDAVVSVPSTFSAWAAFMGRASLIPIASATDDLSKAPVLARHLHDAWRDPTFRLAVN